MSRLDDRVGSLSLLCHDLCHHLSSLNHWAIRLYDRDDRDLL